MLEHKSFYMSSEITVPRISEFRVVEPSDLPQQRKGSNDCGIWVAQWMKECRWTDDFGITVKGRLEGGQLYTPAYVARMIAMVWGAARGITVPTNLTVLWSSLQQLLQEMGGTGGVAIDESFFQSLFNGLVKEGEIQGSVRAGVHWTPAVTDMHLLRTVAAPMVDMLLHDLDEQNKLKNGVELQEAPTSESISVSPGDRVAISKSFPRPLADKALAVVEALEGKDGISNFATNLVVKCIAFEKTPQETRKNTFTFISVSRLNITRDQKLGRRLIFGKGHKQLDFQNDKRRKKIRKFKESAWKCVYFLSAEVLALFVAYDEPWFTNTRNFWVGPGSQSGDRVVSSKHFRLKLKALYMYAAGLYSYSFFALIFWETRRSDFGVSMGHHVATFILIVLSYIVSYEVWLTLDKEKHKVEGRKYYYVFNSLLYCLLVLHIYWWVLIFRMLVRQIQARGKISDDIQKMKIAMKIEIESKTIIFEILKSIYNGAVANDYELRFQVLEEYNEKK
ncbi:hypothetical protein HN51_058564 [Arachis hypogaea]